MITTKNKNNEKRSQRQVWMNFSGIEGVYKKMTLNQQINFNDWADFWRYEIGVNVIPAQTRKKTTYIKWTLWQDKPIPEDMYENWKRTGAFRHGIAVIVGRVFHNPNKIGLYLYCIDCDNKKAKDEFSANWNRLGDSTLIEWHDDNPDKVHIYGYAHKPIPKKGSDITSKDLKEKADRNEFPAFEVKGRGEHGIMFCSPSIHEKGHQYHVGPCTEPKVTDGIEYKIDEICKKYGIPYLSDNNYDDDNTHGTNNTKHLDDYQIPIDKLIHDDAILILAGHNRHEAILRVAEHYVATISDISDDMLYSLTDARNQIICDPPLPPREITKLCKQAVPFVENSIGRPTKKKKKRKNLNVIDYNTIAQTIIDQYNLVTLQKTHDILYWKDGVYLYGAEEIISQQCRIINSNIKNHDIVEILGIIKDKTGYHGLKEFDEDIYRINVQNGYVNLHTGKLEQHNPSYLSRVQLPILYNPMIVPNKFLKYLRSCHDDPHTKYTILEMMGMCLIRDNHLFEIAYMHTGSGANGKSVLFNILENVLGKQNIANKPIHDLENQRFSLSALDGKLANICADIGPDELRTSGNLKKLISGDPVDGEKKYQESYSFRNYAKLIFSANQIPEVFDSSDAFARRFVIIEWTKKFYGDDRQIYVRTIEDDKEELSGIFNIMVAFARILLKTRKIKYEKTVRDSKIAWTEKADSVKNFVDRMCVTDSSEEYSISKQKLYSQYISFCKTKHITIVSSIEFNKKMHNLGLQDIQKRYGSEVTRIWKGITLRSELSGGNERLG